MSNAGLCIQNLSISFGGVQALKKVSFEVRPGEIVGLIGPNGAGKTSLINCISRYYKPSEGKIDFNDKTLLNKKPHQLLELGISRSFQELNGSSSLSVIDSIMVGQHYNIKTSFLRSLVDFKYLKDEDAKFRRQARNVMRYFATVRSSTEAPQAGSDYPDINGKGGYPDLLDVQDIPIGMLPFGIKKKVDLARTLVSFPQLLLLDEPAGGLGQSDFSELIALLNRAKTEFNTGILLVEHQMPLVMKLCDRIVVLNFGEKIAEGTPSEIRNHPAVIEAYLGKKEKTKNIKKELETNTLHVASSEKSDELLKAKPIILEIKDVDLRYGHVVALSRVSMKFQDQSITAILGNNGAGKSSLLRAISGIERLSNGEISFCGEKLSHHLQMPRADKIVRKGIVHVAEGRRIFKELSIMENLKVAGFTLNSRKKMNLNIEKIFHYFPALKSKLKLKDAGNLSGGQQQMLAIGQALMKDPKILLLDEPSFGLSPVLVQELFETISKIRVNEKCAIIIVEQNSEMALNFSESAYVLETGFVLKNGRSVDLVNDDEIKRLYLGN